MVLDSFQEVDQWMLLLSRSGIRELSLTNSNSNEGYELPSYVFRCLELTKLKLWSWFCKQPLMFEGFPNIEHLRLFHINFGANLYGTQMNLPQLKVLEMYVCTHVYNFNVKATKLQSLTVFPCPDARLLKLLNSPCINYLCISIHEPTKDLAPVERIHLARMLSKFPRIRNLYINDGFLKYAIKENIPKWLPQAVNSLKRLSLNIQLGELCQLHAVLCLLRNSPNMESLSIMICRRHPGVDVGPASNHLETPICLDCTLIQLQTVEITWLGGSRVQLLFIRLLLVHSPSLKKFIITPYKRCDAQKRLDIGKDVMQFPRASPKAEIIYLNPTSYSCKNAQKHGSLALHFHPYKHIQIIFLFLICFFVDYLLKKCPIRLIFLAFILLHVQNHHPCKLTVLCRFHKNDALFFPKALL
ncbi:unnamed protein product [Lactuca virosa]|uniref:FBD domain-containing protein n=1 Tax=Lactuca virosa TaxID=75947 RepID=A0AAU9NT50_9ASTR|nr:unnamed protein product [Lactuca virosa]